MNSPLSVIDYPVNVTTDVQKLAAVYSIREQMRLAHNTKAAQARAYPERYLITGKYRTFARISKAKLKLLLLEQNILKEAIRRAAYSRKQWREINNLPHADYIQVCNSLFGNRSVLKHDPTLATCSLLQDIIGADLDNMIPGARSDPTENFTTYTEDDVPGRLTVIANKVTAASVADDEKCILYDDKGASHFDGNWEHLFKFYLDVNTTNEEVGAPYAISDYAGDWGDIEGDAGRNAIVNRVYASSPDYYFHIRELYDGDNNGDYTEDMDDENLYYIENERDTGVGDHGTAYSYIAQNGYWDDGGDQIDTLSRALLADLDYRYVFGYMSYGDGGGDNTDFSMYTEDLDLQEAAAAVTRCFGYII